MGGYPTLTGERRFIATDDELVRVYRNSSGERVTLYIGYYHRQVDGKELTGEAGAALAAAASRVTLTSESGTLDVNEIVRAKAGARRGVLFWYDINGRIVSDLYRLKSYTIWDAMTRRRTNGAVVMIAWNGRAALNRRPLDDARSSSPSAHAGLATASSFVPGSDLEDSGQPTFDFSRWFRKRTTARIRLRVPVIVMVLAATAIPIELRPLGAATLNFGIFASDVLANIVGYLPVGLVLAELGPGRALLTAVLMATLAEAGQFVMMHRDPSVIDVVANAIGAALGIALSQRWNIRSPSLTLSRSKAVVAAMLACALILAERATSGYVPSSRGTTSPGTLEAHWKFDESGGPVAIDSSGHALNGSFRNEPTRVAGVLGRAVKFDGAKDSIDFGRSTALRLVGSMTISAWINSSSFPVDDAAIVSSHNGLGYQLDTTVDKGPRTIGFKLGNECGALMARYGATPLVVGKWYHVAGVYDADARTLDVYLNGELDNGVLVGTVTGGQRSSREKVYVGRRSNLEGFEFAGSIDDVRIYSRALTKAEITAVMRGAVPDNVQESQTAREHTRDFGGRGGTARSVRRPV